MDGCLLGSSPWGGADALPSPAHGDGHLLGFGKGKTGAEEPTGWLVHSPPRHPLDSMDHMLDPGPGAAGCYLGAPAVPAGDGAGDGERPLAELESALDGAAALMGGGAWGPGSAVPPLLPPLNAADVSDESSFGASWMEHGFPGDGLALGADLSTPWTPTTPSKLEMRQQQEQTQVLGLSSPDQLHYVAQPERPSQRDLLGSFEDNAGQNGVNNGGEGPAHQQFQHAAAEQSGALGAEQRDAALESLLIDDLEGSESGHLTEHMHGHMGARGPSQEWGTGQAEYQRPAQNLQQQQNTYTCVAQEQQNWSSGHKLVLPTWAGQPQQQQQHTYLPPQASGYSANQSQSNIQASSLQQHHDHHIGYTTGPTSSPSANHCQLLAHNVRHNGSYGAPSPRVSAQSSTNSMPPPSSGSYSHSLSSPSKFRVNPSAPSPVHSAMGPYSGTGSPATPVSLPGPVIHASSNLGPNALQAQVSPHQLPASRAAQPTPGIALGPAHSGPDAQDGPTGHACGGPHVSPAQCYPGHHAYPTPCLSSASQSYMNSSSPASNMPPPSSAPSQRYGGSMTGAQGSSIGYQQHSQGMPPQYPSQQQAGQWNNRMHPQRQEQQHGAAQAYPGQHQVHADFRTQAHMQYSYGSASELSQEGSTAGGACGPRSHSFQGPQVDPSLSASLSFNHSQSSGSLMGPSVSRSSSGSTAAPSAGFVAGPYSHAGASPDMLQMQRCSTMPPGAHPPPRASQPIRSHSFNDALPHQWQQAPDQSGFSSRPDQSGVSPRPLEEARQDPPQQPPHYQSNAAFPASPGHTLPPQHPGEAVARGASNMGPEGARKVPVLSSLKKATPVSAQKPGIPTGARKPPQTSPQRNKLLDAGEQFEGLKNMGDTGAQAHSSSDGTGKSTVTGRPAAEGAQSPVKTEATGSTGSPVDLTCRDDAEDLDLGNLEDEDGAAEPALQLKAARKAGVADEEDAFGEEGDDEERDGNEEREGGKKGKKRPFAQNAAASAARKRRHDMNQRMKYLLEVVACANKGDTASMLQEVIDSVQRMLITIKDLTKKGVKEHTEGPDHGDAQDEGAEAEEMQFGKAKFNASACLTEEEEALLAFDSAAAANMPPRLFHAARYRIRKKMMAARNEFRAAAGLGAKGQNGDGNNKPTLASAGIHPVPLTLAWHLCTQVERAIPEAALANAPATTA